MSPGRQIMDFSSALKPIDFLNQLIPRSGHTNPPRGHIKMDQRKERVFPDLQSQVLKHIQCA